MYAYPEVSRAMVLHSSSSTLTSGMLHMYVTKRFGGLIHTHIECQRSQTTYIHINISANDPYLQSAICTVNCEQRAEHS